RFKGTTVLASAHRDGTGPIFNQGFRNPEARVSARPNCPVFWLAELKNRTTRSQTYRGLANLMVVQCQGSIDSLSPERSPLRGGSAGGIAHCARSGQPRVIQRERSIDSGRRGDLTPIETSMSLPPPTPFPAGTLHFPAVADPA